MSRLDNADRFLSLLEPLRDGLFRFAARSVWNKDQAADVVQETVLVAWSQFDRFEPGTNFRAWLFRILLNTLYRLNRRGHRQRKLAVGSIDGDTLPAAPPGWDSILENPDRVLDTLDERLVDGLLELSEAERQCLLLRLLEDFSYREIADLLDMPMGTVMSHVYRARMKLRARLSAMALEIGVIKANDEEAPARPAGPPR